MLLQSRFLSFQINERISKDCLFISLVFTLGGRIAETAPALPDFALALKPDDYQLPAVDDSWNEDGMTERELMKR